MNRQIQPFHISSTLPISHYKYNEWLNIAEIGIWVTTTHFQVMSGYKFGLVHTHFSQPDWVSSGWFRQFTASQPFQSFIISILNGNIRLRLEFILNNQHCTLTFESREVKMRMGSLHLKSRLSIWTDRFSHFISAQPFQSLIISIMNG